MIKLIIKNPNGSIETKMLSHDSTFTPKAGQQFYFDNSDGSRKYTFNLADGEESIELVFAGNAERLKFNLNGMADLIKQSDTALNEKTKTVLGIMNDEDGLKELNQTALNDNFQGDKVISELKQLLDDTNNPDEKYQNGIIIDDFGALAEQLDAAAAGAGPLGQNSGATDDPIATIVNTYAVGARGVGDTLDRSYGTVDLQGIELNEVEVSLSGDTYVGEGGTAYYTVSLSETANSTVNITLKIENETTSDNDFINIIIKDVNGNVIDTVTYTNGMEFTVTIPAGYDDVTFDVVTKDDYYNEGEETFKVSIVNITANEYDTVTTGNDTVETIIDDEEVIEDEDTVYVVIDGDAIVSEGETASYTIKLLDINGNEVVVSEDTVVKVKFSNITTEDNDTEYTDGQIIEVTIKAGTSSALLDTITLDDPYADNGEIYNLTIDSIDTDEFEAVDIDGFIDINGTNYSGTINTTILDNSNPDTPDTPDEPDEETVTYWLTGPDSVAEGAAATGYVIHVDVAPQTDMTFTIQTGNVTTQDGDIIPLYTTVTILAGQLESLPFEVQTVDDPYADNGEIFKVEITDVNGGNFETLKAGVTTVETMITDNDIIPDAKDDKNYVTETGSENILSEDIYDTIAGHDDGKLTATGDVMSNDSGNVNITITQVVFASVVYTLPTDGSNLVIDTPLGQLSINNTGVYTYTVDDNAIDGWDETDSQDEVFTYTLSDGANPDDTANLTITVEGRDDAPIIQNITTADINLNNDASIKYTLDVDGDGVTDTLSQSALLAQDRGLIFEEDNGNLQIDLGEGGRDVAIEYHGGNASYKNIFGYYQLDANGNPTNFVILYADAGDEDGDGSNFDKNMNVDLGVLQDLEGEIGFFIIPDGNSNSSIASAVSDILTNPNSTWTISADSSNHIVLTNGSTTITTADTYYTDNNLSTDGRDHAIAGISEDGTGITIGFEDLPENSTDQDYDDFVFTIKYCDTTGDNGQLFTNVNFTDVDDANLTSATVTLTDAQVGDTLSIDLTELPTGINAVISGNTITFTNVASLDDYEDAIEAIRFATTSSDRSTREFEIEISDGIKTDSITKTVNIIGCEIETYSPVYVKIVEADSVIEGDTDNTLTHKVILVDAAGNAVTVPDGESVTVTLNYTDGTGLTNDDFTTARQVTVTINGGESEALVTNYVKNDLTPEGTESYTVEIESIDNNPFDTDLINSGTSTTGTIIDNDVSVTVDLEVDPGAEKLEGTSVNATSIELVIKDENGVEVFRTTVTPDANGNWSVPVSQLPDFDEEIDYTVTATAKDNVGNEAEATDTDMYDLLPTVTVDLEVDPGAEKLEGTSVNATSIELVIKDENGVEVFRTTVTPDANGNWSVPVSQLPNFDEEIDYTVTATAKDNVGNEAEATDTDMYDLKPTITVESASVDEDFITNLGNFTNPDGDTAQNTSTDSGKIETNATEVVFADNQTTSLTSDGNIITLTTSDDGKSITGTANGETIFTAVINDAGTSYDFTLSGNIDHPYGDNIETVETLELTIVASDANGNNTLATLAVEIGDDIPCANDADVIVDVDTTPVNLIFTLDISGSMGDIVDGTGKTKLQIAVEAMKDLVDGYESQGKTVNVQLTTFSTEATNSTVWMNSSTFATVLAALKANGWTNYEDALQTTVSNYENSIVPTGTTYAYFLSDGAPTVEMNDKTLDVDDVTSGNTQDGIDGSFVDTVYVNEWNQFVSDNNIAEVYAVGIGNYVSETYLEKITTSDNVIIVKEDDLVNLSATLQETIATQDGILTYCCGADGLESFTWGTDVVATDANGNEIAVVWTLVGTTLTGTINGETVIKLEATNIGTDSVKYVISELDENSVIEDIKVPYIITDGDGDSVTAYLNIDIVVPVDDIPTISVVDPVIVDEDALPAINTTDTDGYNNVYFETKSFTYDFGNDGVGSIQFTSGQTTSITSDEQDITLVYSNNNQTITGVSEDGTSIFTISLDVANSQYTFTLLENVDHPVQNAEDLLVGLSFEVEIVDGNGSRAYDVIDVKIADDIACANDADISVDAMNSTPVNLIFTLDISGSMGDIVDGTGKTKLQIAVESIEDLVASYEAQGRVVNVQLTTFSTEATESTIWLDSATLALKLEALKAGGWTNYEDALQTTEYNYENSIVPTGTTYAYFISDGNPTVEMNDTPSCNNNDPITDGNTQDGIDDFVDPSYVAAWNQFVIDNNIAEVYAVGIGTSVSTAYLSEISSNVLMVDDIKDLSATLQQTVITEEGTLIYCSGADGLESFTWGTDVVATDANGNEVAVVWTLVGTVLTGTINGETVIKLEAIEITANGAKYVISEVSENSGIDMIKVPYIVTDGDGDSVTAYLNIDTPVNTIPTISAGTIEAIEDTTYSISLSDFGTYSDADGDSLVSIKIETLPTNGVLILNGIQVTAGTTILASDINDGDLVFKPNYNTDEDSSFTYQVSDGSLWSETQTMSVDVTAVADAPVTTIDVTRVSNIVTIDETNVKDTTKGYTVSAYNADGTASTISIITGTEHDGFGVAGTTTQTINLANDSEIAYDTKLNASEEIRITFDNDVSSIEFSFAWKHGYDMGDGTIGETAVVKLYKDGVLVETKTYTGGTDTIDGPYTLEASNGVVFDEVRFSSLGDGDDYLIHELTYEESATLDNQSYENYDQYSVDITAALTDLDGSETLTVTISNVPTGAILSSDTYSLIDNGDGTWDVTVPANTTSITDSIDMVVPKSVGDFDLVITARATETNDNSNGDNYKEATDSDAIVYSYNETNDLAFGEASTNLLFTLDVSGSMADKVKDSSGNYVTRFEIEKASVIATIEAYGSKATEVNITLFNSSALNYGWMATAQAIAFLSSLSMNSNGDILMDGKEISGLTGNMTDYYDALNATMSVNFTGHDADTTVAYFLSDGNPNDNSDKIDQDSDTTIKEWSTYVSNNIDMLNVIGVGADASESALKVVQVQDGDTVIMVKDESTLGDVLVGTVVSSIDGNVLENISGGDGDISIDSIVVDGITYTSSDFPNAGISVNGDGILVFDFTTGDYTYSAKSSEFANDTSKSFIVNASDENGDSTSVDVLIAVDITPNSTLNILELTGNDIDLSDYISSSLDGINMTNNSHTDVLNIDLDDIIDLENDGASELKIFGDSGDKVTLEGGTDNWANAGKTEIDGEVFNVYQGTDTSGNSNIKILIDTDVSIDPEI